MCVLGKRLLKDVNIANCTKDVGGELYQLFCPNNTCDPYFSMHNLSIVPGIKVQTRYYYPKFTLYFYFILSKVINENKVSNIYFYFVYAILFWFLML